MKILFLISQLPYPPDTGAKIRSFNLITKLSKSHAITLVTYGDREDGSDKFRKFEDMGVKAELVSGRPCNPYIAALKNIFSRYPYSVAKYYSKDMSERIRMLSANGQFDLIHCDSLQMSKNILNIRSIPKVMTEHNIESLILKRAAENTANIFKKFYFYIQYLKLRKYEIFACRQFDRVITVSGEDRRFFAKFIPEGNITVVPNGVDTEFFMTNGGIQNMGDGNGTIVFTGSMDWMPNADAVEYFCADILPIIWKTAPDVKFYIVGRNQSRNINELGEKDKRIIVTGVVEDTRPYIDRAKVIVAPLRIGGGTRLKILEAFSMRKSVVSTSIGCEGLAVSHGRDIMIADEPSGFASEVLNLLKESDLRRRLGDSGRRLVEDRYDWEGIAESLNAAWHETVNHRAVPILLYHDICDNGFDIRKADAEARPYILDEYEFEKQMKYLHDNGYRTPGLKEFLESETRSAAGGKTALVVFDDGYISNHTKALGILKRYDIRATFFIAAGLVGRDGMMTWRHIKDLIASGMEIGSHGLTHAIPVNLSDESMEDELNMSKEILENNLGVRIDYFSSPTGFYNPVLPEAAKRAGYRVVLISRSALNGSADNYILNKTGIKRHISFKTFVSVVKQDNSVFKSLRKSQNIRDSFKKILGPDMYNSLRRAILERA